MVLLSPSSSAGSEALWWIGAWRLAPWKNRAPLILLPWFLHCSPLTIAKRQGDTKAKPYKTQSVSPCCSHSCCGLRSKATGPCQRGQEVTHRTCAMRIQSHHDPADAVLMEPCTISLDFNGLALDKLTQREGRSWANSNSRKEFL